MHEEVACSSSSSDAGRLPVATTGIRDADAAAPVAGTDTGEQAREAEGPERPDPPAAIRIPLRRPRRIARR